MLSSIMGMVERTREAVTMLKSRVLPEIERREVLLHTIIIILLSTRNYNCTCTIHASKVDASMGVCTGIMPYRKNPLPSITVFSGE